MATPVKLVEDTLFGYSQNFPTADPHVAALSDGSFLVTAEATDNSGDIDIVAERFALDVVNGGFFQTNYIFSGGFPGDIVNSTQSSVVGLAGNSVAVVWTNKPTDTNDADIHAKIFSLNGGGASAEIVVNVGDTAGNQVRPEVAELYPGGPVAFAWIDLATFAIKAAVFDQFGRAITTNMTVSTTEATNVSSVYDLGLTALSNGGMVVSWTDDNNQSYFRVGSSSGFFNDQVALAGTGPTDVTALADGGFVATYSRGGASFATIFNSSGTVTVSEFQIAASSGFEAVTALQDGRFMFAYSAGGEIWGSIWNADGTRSSNEFMINTDASGGKSRPHLETLADGTVAVTWEVSSTNGPDIYSTIIDPREAGIQLAGSSFDDSFFGTRYADTIILAGGNDRVDAREGNDQIYGGSGIDTIRGGAGNDKIDGGAGFDTALFSGVRAAYTLTDLGNGSVRVVGPDGTDTLTSIEVLQFADRAISWPSVTIHHAESDFGGDNISDILWRNSAGQLAVWQLDASGKPTSATGAGSLATSWHVEGTGDFNADGKADILWHNDNGQTMIWTMNGSQHTGTINLGGVGTSWHVQGAADLSNDGTSDIVWRNTTGSLVVWNMTGTGQVGSTVNLGSVSNAYHIQAFDDFNGDGKEDILWRNDNGQVVLWQMNGAQVAAGTTVGSLSSAWHIQGSGDFDGDSKADILWRSDTGQAAIWFMNGPQIANTASIGTLSGAWQIETTGDYNGDGKDDILWRNTTTGQAAEWLMNGSHVAGTVDLGKLPTWDVAHHQFDIV